MSLVWRGVQVAAGVNYLGGGVDLYVFVPNADGTFAVVTEPPAFVTVEQDATPPALFTLEKKAAQRLMDDLWWAGLRPSAAQAGDATLAAKDAHIADLRGLLFGAEGPKSGLADALIEMLSGPMAEALRGETDAAD